MTLTEAKLIADHPDLAQFTVEELRAVQERLAKCAPRAVRSERAWARLERRQSRLADWILAVENHYE